MAAQMCLTVGNAVSIVAPFDAREAMFSPRSPEGYQYWADERDRATYAQAFEFMIEDTPHGTSQAATIKQLPPMTPQLAVKFRPWPAPRVTPANSAPPELRATEVCVDDQ